MSVEVVNCICYNDVSDMKDYTGGDFSVEDIVNNVNKGEWKAFFIKENEAKKGIIVYMLCENNLAFILAATGKHITTYTNWEDVKNHFRSVGATKIEAAMRDSTLRLWKRLGFVKKYNVAEVNI